MVVNKQVILAAYPVGLPRESDFRLEEHTVPELGRGEFLVRAVYLSVDPFLRMQMNPTTEDNLAARKHGTVTDVGRLMAGGMVGEVARSRHPGYDEGIIVEGILGWQLYAVTDGWTDKRHNPAGVVKCDLSLDVPIASFGGVLGRAGLTGYFCMTRELKPQPGETAVITSAAGAGGSIAGQIAKIAGCHVVGVVGSDEKVRHIVEDLGFDVGINYKTTNDVASALRDACPSGVDVHYDNVGGSTRDAIASLHTPGHRYRMVGVMSQYNEIPEGKDFWAFPFTDSLFVVHHYTQDFPTGIRKLASWIHEGKLKYRDDIVHDIKNTPRAFIGLFKGENIGKRLVKVAPEPGESD